MTGKKKSQKLILRLANSGLQMGVVIFLGAYSGDYLDTSYNNNTPVFTIIGSLLGVFIGLFLLYKSVIKISK